MKLLPSLLLTAALAAPLTSASAQTTAKKPAASPGAAPAPKTTTAPKPTASPAAKSTKPAAAKPPVSTTPPPAKPAAAHSEAGPAPSPRPSLPASSSSGNTRSGGMGLSGSNDAFSKGTTAANLGIGLIGTGGWYATGASVTPLINLSVEHGIIDNVGPGVIGIGGAFGFRRASYDYGFFGSSYKWTWTDIYVGVRGTYHYNFTGNPKFDTYGGIGLGARIWKFKDDYSEQFSYSYKASGATLTSGLFVGARYYFTDNIGAFGEFGYDLALLKLGISAKF